MSGDRKVLTVNLLVDKAKNHVIFVESDHEFVDTIVSFLTLPLATVLNLLQPTSPELGSATAIHRSVSSLDVRRFCTPACKSMLLNPRSVSEAQCRKLKLNIEQPESGFMYACFGCFKRFSFYKGPVCKCGSKAMHRVEIVEEKRIVGVGVEEDNDGVFVKEGATRFMVTNDLFVIPGSTASYLALLQKHGINNGSEVEQRTVEIGTQEVLQLLICSVLSKSPLTDTILLGEGRAMKKAKVDQKRSRSERKGEDANPNAMTLKLLVSKCYKRVLYAEAGIDVADFLFSLLTLPLGSIVKLLDMDSGMGCMDNLYSSIADLSTGGHIKSEESKMMLSCPKLAPCFGIENQLLQVEEAELPRYVRRNGSKLFIDTNEPGSNPLVQTVEIMDPKSPTGEAHARGGYLKQPATFMIKDDLTVTVLSPISSIAILEQLKVPINDVGERVVSIGRDEALKLLKASLTSKTALNDVFNQEYLPKVKVEV